MPVLPEACDKEDLGGSNIHVPEFDYNALSETDKYIYDHYTVPYNVEVVYRWNQGDVSSDDMRKNLVPPRESQVEPFLEMIEKVWVDTYTAEVGQQTLRSYIPSKSFWWGVPVIMMTEVRRKVRPKADGRLCCIRERFQLYVGTDSSRMPM